MFYHLRSHLLKYISDISTLSFTFMPWQDWCLGGYANPPLHTKRYASLVRLYTMLHQQHHNQKSTQPRLCKRHHCNTDIAIQMKRNLTQLLFSKHDSSTTQHVLWMSSVLHGAFQTISWQCLPIENPQSQHIFSVTPFTKPHLFADVYCVYLIPPIPSCS